MIIHRLALLMAVFLTACTSPKPAGPPVTSAARSSIAESKAASAEATRASERSSVHIKEFRTDAERIDYKAGRALDILNRP